MAAAIEALADQLRTMRADVAALATELRVVQLRTDQLAALQVDDSDAADRIDQLEGVLDAEGVIRHVTAAVARSTFAHEPFPHLVVSEVLPDPVYRAMVDAIPPAVFFDAERQHRYEIPVPPVLAPIDAIVTWTFVVDVVRKTLAPAILARFEEPLTRTLAASRGHLALRRPGEAIPRDGRRTAPVLTTVVPLAGEGVDDVQLVLERAQDASQSRAIALPRNSALAFLSALGRAALPAAESEAPGLHTYEFSFSNRHDAATAHRSSDHSSSPSSSS